LFFSSFTSLFFHSIPTMPSFSSLALLALPLAALGAPSAEINLRRGLGLKSRAFTLVDHFQGADFLKWTFFAEPDPTHGSVNYQTQPDAVAKGLAFVDPADGTMVLKVDNTTVLQKGQNRDSIRISSPNKYTTGLFIADFEKMPKGPTTWPAWWSVGDLTTWPADGEIDVLEGVNDAVVNQMTLHTSADCTLDTTKAELFTGVSKNPTDCESPGPNNDNLGCAVVDSGPNVFGQDFNVVNGGVTAHIWDTTGIKVWRFQRGAIPADITAKTPNPANWGKPAVFFASTTCDMTSHFKEHNLVINTALCGDFAGAVFPGGLDACQQAVTDPANYDFAEWRINSVDVYSIS